MIKFQLWINWYYIDGIIWFSGTIIELKYRTCHNSSHTKEMLQLGVCSRLSKFVARSEAKVRAYVGLNLMFIGGLLSFLLGIVVLFFYLRALKDKKLLFVTFFATNEKTACALFIPWAIKARVITPNLAYYCIKWREAHYNFSSIKNILP